MSADEIWTCKDGRKLAVGEMGEEHVRNALRLMLRRQREAKEKLSSPTASALLKLLVLEMCVEKRRREMDEAALHESIMESVMEDRKWGS